MDMKQVMDMKKTLNELITFAFENSENFLKHFYKNEEYFLNEVYFASGRIRISYINDIGVYINDCIMFDKFIEWYLNELKNK